MSMQETFHPPAAIGVPLNKAWTTLIPGVFSTGARIDFYITGRIEDYADKLTFLLTEGLNGGVQLEISIADTNNLIFFSGFGTAVDYVGFPDALYDSTEGKYSFVAQNNYTLQVLVDDQVIKTKELMKGRLYDITRIVAYDNGVTASPTFIRRFEFSEA